MEAIAYPQTFTIPYISKSLKELRMEPYLMSESSYRNRNMSHDTILGVLQLRKAELYAEANS